MKFKKYLKQFTMTLALLSLSVLPTYAANLGDQLSSPESGWQRIDIDPSNEFELSSGITFNGNYNGSAYNDSLVYSKITDETIKFKFSGTSLRVTGLATPDRSTDITISIDGVEEQMNSHNHSPAQFQTLIYEKTGLSDQPHEVIITSGQNLLYKLSLDSIDINSDGSLLDLDTVIGEETVILDVIPEEDTIETGDSVTVDLTINNITEISAEDILIEYDNDKLRFKSFDEVDGIKLAYSEVDEDNGTIRIILASQGESHIINDEQTLLQLNFKAISKGDALIDITKGKVTDGIEMEKDLEEEDCDQAIIKIEGPSDVNFSGEFTLLDLGIDARHFSRDPSISELSSYNTDIVINNAIDDEDLLEIAQRMMSNSNYELN